MVLAAPPMAEATAKPTRPVMKILPVEHVAEPTANEQQAAEGEGIGRHDPLPVAVGEPSALWADGKAMFIMVVSSTTISCATAMTARISQRLSPGAARRF